MVDKLIHSLVELMLKEHLIDKGKQDDYVYALTCMTESIVTIGVILIISCFFDNIIPTISFLFFFFALRKRSGGYHARTFAGCFVGSICAYIAVVALCLIPSFSKWLQWILLFASGMLILILGAVNHPNMNMNQDEFKSTKNSTRLIAILETGIILFLAWLEGNNMVISYMSAAVILCGILLGLAKILRQEVTIYEKADNP